MSYIYRERERERSICVYTHCGLLFLVLLMVIMLLCFFSPLSSPDPIHRLPKLFFPKNKRVSGIPSFFTFESSWHIPRSCIRVFGHGHCSSGRRLTDILVPSHACSGLIKYSTSIKLVSYVFRSRNQPQTRLGCLSAERRLQCDRRVHLPLV